MKVPALLCIVTVCKHSQKTETIQLDFIYIALYAQVSTQVVQKRVSAVHK